MPRTVLLAALLVVAAASGASAQSSDLVADSSSVSPAVAYEPYFVTVYMSNLGPDVYTAGSTRITVDIDDPTKPGIAGGSLDGSVCRDSVTVIFPTSAVPVGGQVSFTFQDPFGPCGLAVIRIRSTVEPQGAFTDPVPANNTVITDHTFAIPVPLRDWRLLTLLVVLLAGSGLWWMRRRRTMARL